MATGAEPSESIGPYRLDGRIGEGGMGEVYRGFDARLNRPVAIKMMHVAGPEQAPAVDRLLREARAASALNHPNIVTIYEIGQTPEGRSYIVQELIEGRTLRHLLEAPPPLETMINVGTQVARALAAAHAAGIVHRDIKPENIMVRADGYVKVLDFGLARVTELDADPAGLPTRSQATVPGTILGTLAYMSPEQAHAGVAGPPSDVFTLGVVLYEMAAGRRPFAAPTTAGLLAAIVSEQPVPLVRVNSAVSHGLDALVQRMLAKAPGHRPTAGEVEGALAAIQNPESRAVAAPAGGAPSHAVGRDVERAALQRAYTGVKNGRSLLLAVSGEAGIGKTTLVEDFLAELTAGPERPIVTRGRCSEQLAGEEAYLPLLEALENLLHRGAASPVDAVMKAVAPTWYLQVAMAAQESVSTTALRDERALSQERMKRELGAFFQDVSRSRPIVVVLEDLHWADVSTVDMLSYLAARFSDMRVLLLVTYRSTDMALAQHPFLRISHDLQSRGAFEALPLGFLELGDVERYLALAFPGHTFPPSFGAMIHAKTEGSPLFMADLVRYIHASDGITQQDDQWRVSDRVEVSVRDLPASVRGMISWKIEQLDEADRRLLVAASVQGHEFDSATVADAADMDPGDVEERLEVLGRVHAFVSRGEEREFPDRTLTVQYRFVHVLYQNVLHASLQPTRRATLSGRVARALAARHATEIGPIAGRVALLWEAARDFAQSAQYFLAAAQHAIGLFAFREAALLTDRGLDALRGAPEGPQRLQQELGLQMTKAVALRSTTGWVNVDVEHTTARARQLCRELGDPPQLFPVLWGFALLQLIRGNLLDCRERADDLLARATETGDLAFLMAAHHLAGVSCEFTGDLAESRRLLERARELHLPAEHRKYEAMFGTDPGLSARALSGPVLWALGYPDRALERAREAVALRESLKVFSTLLPLVMLQSVLADRGEASEAVAGCEATLAICREYGLPQEAEWSRSYQSAALIRLGRTDEGIDLLKDSLAVQERANAHIGRSMYLAMLANGLRQAERIDEGLQVVDEGFLWAERLSEERHVAELHRIRGELLRLAGQEAAAEESLHEAIAFAARQQTKSFELRAATGLARLLMAAGRAPEARAVLAPVYGWFTEGHTTTDLVAAKTLLSELD